MKRLKSLIRKDKSLRATNDPGYDVVPSDLSTFRRPTEWPKVERRISEEPSPWDPFTESPKVERRISEEPSPWDPFSPPRKEDNLPGVFDIRPTQGETEPYMKAYFNVSSESFLITRLPARNTQYSSELNPDFTFAGSHDSARNSRIPDEDLLGPASDVDTNSGSPHLAPENAPVAQSLTQEQKRRRRRESHNLVERRRRDNINESIRTLAFLAPGDTDRDRPKQAILEKAVSWTRDLMWALHLKSQRESTLKDVIKSLGGSPFIVDTAESLDNVEESIVEKEVQIALETNNITSFSSADQAPRHRRRASEPLKEHSIYHKKPHDYPPARRLHKVTSRGSIISYVASVHSVTSLTYRSPAGVIETETYEDKSNLSYYPNQLMQHQARQDSNDSKYTQAFLTPNVPAKESPMLKRFMIPFATKEGMKASAECSTPAPENGVDLQTPIKISENFSELNKEVSTTAEIVAQDASKIEGGESFSESAAAVSLEDADNVDQDATSLARRPDQGTSNMMAETFAVDVSESNDSLKKSNLEISQDDTRHGSQDASDVQHENYSAVYLDNGLVRLRWTCSCQHPFQIGVLEHQKRAAVIAINELARCTDQDERDLGLQYPLRSFSGLSEKIINVFRFQASDESLPHVANPSTTADDLVKANPEASIPGPDRYICVCFPGITYKKYLHHVDVNRAADDPMLFSALKRKYFDWKPLWRRILTLRTLARVEYFEFKVFHSNLVTIKDDWRDRFPQGHGPEEWAYTPTTRDMTPYLIDDVLTHYVHNPECAKRGTYFWKRIPKKLFCQLECPDDRPFKVGWGLYFIEDFSQFYLMLILVPVLIGGVAVAAWYCASYGKSFADGATVASGFAALVMYMFSVAQGWAKQKGTI